MSANLVIVESPAKAKTIAKFLGKDFEVQSSFGHVRDLPKKGMSVDIANNFTPQYEVSPDKKKTVAQLRKAAKNATTIWLASDEDREGEAIAWHLSEVLKLKPQNTKRIVFHEITKPAIEAAVKNPRTIDANLVNAQQARRVLDRIVGYELSPVLWKKVATGLSAGRVQSVAVRLIVDREREIEGFEPTSNYKVAALFTLKDGTELKAEAPVKYETEAKATAFLKDLAKSTCTIKDVQKTPGTRSPSAPFTTSTLQQEAARRLGYSPKQTMMLAQRLYENGHITYMRTDSTNLSQVAIAAMSDLIKKEYGPDYLQVRAFKTKSAGAQEAHEAIRPTSVAQQAAGDDPQQKKLYSLIWQRALASQMAPAKLEKTTITIGLSESQGVLEAKGEVVQFPGFLKVYGLATAGSGGIAPAASGPEGDIRDETRGVGTSKADTLLPPVKVGDLLTLISALAEQTYARAPSRYTEASLVRKLEELGIGRPSTYAPTISTIQDRGYVEKADVVGGERNVIRLTLQSGKIARHQADEPVPTDKGKLVPTDTGKVVNDFLVQHFQAIIDYDFTKDVEQEFDDIAAGKLAWQTMLEHFYKPFHKTVEKSESISRAEAMQARQLGTDPKTGRPVSARFGRFGPMVQLGTAEDEEKPRFASIPSNLSVDTITLEQALSLLTLPRTLGSAEDGQPIEANIGRFGPYVKVGGRYISLGQEDPYTVTLETAQELIKADSEKRAKMTIQDFSKEGIKVLNGRYGPYITNGTKNAKVPKDQDPAKLTLEECKQLLQKAPTRSGRSRRVRKTK